MFKRAISWILVLSMMISLMTNINVEAAVKTVGLSSVTMERLDNETEEYIFKLSNFKGRIRSKFNLEKYRVFVEIKNANYNQIKKKSKKITKLVEESIYIKKTSVKVVSKKEREVKLYFYLKKKASYEYTKTKKGFKLTLFNTIALDPTTSPSEEATEEPTESPAAPSEEVTQAPSESPSAEPEPSATPRIESVVEATSDDLSINISVPRAEMVQFTPKRTSPKKGGSKFVIPLCGLDNYLAADYSGMINMDAGSLAIETLTENRSTLTVKTKTMSDLVAYKSEEDTALLKLDLAPNAIDKCWYTSYFRKAVFRINLPYIEDFEKIRSDDGTEFLFKADAKALDMADGVYAFNDNLLREVEITTDAEGKKNVLLRATQELVFKVKKGTDGEFIKIYLYTPQSVNEKLIVLDPGHGGKDAGATANYKSGGKTLVLNEKDVNLDIVLFLDKFLTDRGVRVELTRYDDSYVSLSERYNYANDVEADLFMSVHHNAHEGTYAKGTETYYYKNKNTLDGLTDKKFARIVNNSVIDTIGTVDRDVKTAAFAVIKGTKMSAILLETCFLTNVDDRKIIKKQANRKKIAQNLAISISDMLQALE